MKNANISKPIGKSSGNFGQIKISDYQIMRHIQKTCKGYENILEAIK